MDEVVIFKTATELKELIRDYSPEIMVVGSDWKGKPVVGADGVGRVVYFDRIENYSTTAILERKN